MNVIHTVLFHKKAKQNLNATGSIAQKDLGRDLRSNPSNFGGLFSHLFNEIRSYVPQENTYYNTEEAWTLEVILAMNLK